MKLFITALIVTLIASSCKNKEKEKFTLLKSEDTNIYFNNTVDESIDFNPLNFIYIYNGAGLGAGDINNNGLPDLFFAGNSVPSKLYLNKGDFIFEDITEQAGITHNRWVTGVNFVDINTDGLLDIYLCVADKDYTSKGENLLYINQGDNTFKEEAKVYGLNDAGYSTQAVFFDYDLDGDLDMYLLTNAIETFTHNSIRPRKLDGSGKSTDRLYRNNGNLTFTNVSEEAGITSEGYGLGIGILDINNDGFLDIYCANDFITNDLLWINNGDGTFTDRIRDYVSQTSYNGMGLDIADYNNDGLVDIVEMDMLPETNLHNKTMTPAMNYNYQTLRFQLDYLPQYVRNTLQLQNEDTYFSEIGRLANISKTDWSWGPLLADLNNDGYKDLFISNGYGRDITDLDYINYSAAANNPFGTEEVRTKLLYESVNKLPPIDIPNYFFKNEGDLTFKDVTKQWSEAKNSISNGAIYVDLDKDGDLDLVTNNLNSEAFIYKNNTNSKNNKDATYLKIDLDGPSKNTKGIGTTVIAYNNGQKQIVQQFPVRGYLSSVDYTLHFGFGKAGKVDSLEIIWPDKKVEMLYSVSTNNHLTIDYKNARTRSSGKNTSKKNFLFDESSKTQHISHKENSYIDFHDQPLLLKMMSREGPGIAVADINNDGLDDICMSTALNDTTYTWMQDEMGDFVRGSSLPNSWKLEQQGVLIFDANHDGLKDIYIASGGQELPYDLKNYQDQLYLQEADGSFKISNAIPEMLSSTATVNASDFDKDGDLDLFVGSRLLPSSYPLQGKSYILQNENGKYKDVTQEVASELSDIGMVTSALWTDFNNDGQMDLIVVGEWMEINLFKNENGKFKNITKSTSLSGLTGFWNSIQGGDFDLDGDIDYIVGNLGENSALRASKKEPVSLLAKDFDNNGKIDPIIGYYVQGKNYPLASRNALINQISSMKKRFPSYKSYGETTFDKLFDESEMVGAMTKEITTLSSIYIENTGNNTFVVKPLPVQAQMAPVYGISIVDLNNDNYPDILLTGNRRDSEILSGFLDGSIGTTLINDKKGFFTAMNHTKSGFITPNDTRGIAKINGHKGMGVLVANNDKALQYFQLPEESKKIKLDEKDQYAIVELKNGKSYKIEFYYGSGYLTQDSRVLEIPENAKQITIFNALSKKRVLKI